MIYVMNKLNWQIIGTFENMSYVKEWLNTKSINVATLKFLTEQDDMIKYVSRITYMEYDNEKTCIYNNKDFWMGDLSTILSNYENYKFTDILGKEISRDRFITEMNTNIDRLNAIDGRPGEILYNKEVGEEFISLFREECILTDFTKEADTSPMIIFNKLSTAIAMIDIGGFREARQFLQAALNAGTIIDDFLTEERINKYIEMLSAADSIEYATDEDYFYTVPETTTEAEDPIEPSDGND